jgi:hypothetical protein
MAVQGNQTDIKAALGRLTARFRDTVCKKYAAEAEQIAKENRPWTDRTADARKLIKGVVLDNEEVKLDVYKQAGGGTGSVTIDGTGCVGIALAHRVEYGRHLETANSGRYAILKPTIEGLRADFLATAKKFFGDKRG